MLCQRKWHFSGLHRSSRPGLLTKEGLSLAAVLSGFFQSVFPYLKTLLDGFFPFEGVGRGQIVESGMKPFVVVFVDVSLDDFLGLLKSAQGLSPDAFGLKGLMEAFDLPVGLGMSDPDPGMNDLLVPQVGAEFGGEILRTVVGDDARFGHALWKGLQRPLDEELDIGCRHGQAKIPEDDGPGIAVQDTDEEIMRAPEIDIRDVGVPLLMRTLGLMEALPGGFFPFRKSPLTAQSGLSEHAKDRGGRDGHNPLVQHHEGQPDAAYRRIFALEGQDLFSLLRQDPVSLGHNALRTRRLARKAGPAVIGPGWKIQDGKGFLDGKSGPLLKMCHSLYDLFRRFRRNVGPGERSPVLFFKSRFSVESSETTDSSFRIRSSFSRISRCRTFLCWCISLENVCSIPSRACLAHPRISPGVLPVSSARSARPTWSFRYRRTIWAFSSTASAFSSHFPGGRNFPCAHPFW